MSLELSEQADIEAAYGIADAEGQRRDRRALHQGDEHRLLVVGGKVVPQARRKPVGDRRWHQHCGPPDRPATQHRPSPRERGRVPPETIKLDRRPAIRLLFERQGLSGETVPAAGQRVLIQRNGSVAIDCTDEVHPDVAFLVGLAARVVGLDIAGIDLVTQDISRPCWSRGRGGRSQRRPRFADAPEAGRRPARPVGKHIVDHLFDETESGRIPIIGVGSHSVTEVSRLVAWLLQPSGRHVGPGLPRRFVPGLAPGRQCRQRQLGGRPSLADEP